MALTDTAIKKPKAADQPLKVSDERGLYLLVKPQGAKLWRLKYRHLGKEKLMALGGDTGCEGHNNISPTASQEHAWAAFGEWGQGWVVGQRISPTRPLAVGGGAH